MLNLNIFIISTVLAVSTSDRSASLRYLGLLLGLLHLFAGLLCLSLVVEVLEIAVFAEALGVMRAVRMLTCARLLRVALLVVAGVAHELGAMPLLGVLAEEDVKDLKLLLAEVEPLAHLSQMVVLYLTHTIFLELLYLFVLSFQGQSRLLLRLVVAGHMVMTGIEQVKRPFLHEQTLKVRPVGLDFFRRGLWWFSRLRNILKLS